MRISIAALMAAFIATGAAFHFYWGFGGRAGRGVAVPHRVDGAPLLVPSAAATLGVAFVLSFVVTVLVAYVSGWTFALPRRAWQIGIAALGLIFLARGLAWHPYVGLFKSVRDTDFARNDTLFYSPGCVLTGFGFLFLAWEG